MFKVNLHFYIIVILLVIVCIVIIVQPAAPAPDGVLSSYLVGSYERQHQKRTTVLQIINPTTMKLRAVFFFLDGDEHFQRCDTLDLSPDDMLEVDLATKDIKQLPADSGVVKIISIDIASNAPTAGLVGYKRTFVGSTLVSEAPLLSIPSKYAAGELRMFSGKCLVYQ